MSKDETTLNPVWFGIDPAKPFTFWQKVKLFFRRAKISRDGTSYVVAKQMDDKIYIVDCGEFK